VEFSLANGQLYGNANPEASTTGPPRESLPLLDAFEINVEILLGDRLVVDATERVVYSVVGKIVSGPVVAAGAQLEKDLDLIIV
jgi:hypothetical protein